MDVIPRDKERRGNARLFRWGSGFSFNLLLTPRLLPSTRLIPFKVININIGSKILGQSKTRKNENYLTVLVPIQGI